MNVSDKPVYSATVLRVDEDAGRATLGSLQKVVPSASELARMKDGYLPATADLFGNYTPATYVRREDVSPEVWEGLKPKDIVEGRTLRVDRSVPLYSDAPVYLQDVNLTGRKATYYAGSNARGPDWYYEGLK